MLDVISSVLKLLAVLIALAIAAIVVLWIAGGRIGFRVNGNIYADETMNFGINAWVVSILLAAETMIAFLLILMSRRGSHIRR